ncbi:receptor cytoplasmic kinase [Trifolium repens]|nr:receptor cytoplasmic kinase [Trifolium repens]
MASCCLRVKVESDLTHDDLNSKVLTSRTESEISKSNNILKSFTFNELETATGNFNLLDDLLGKGEIIKGWIDEQTLAPTKPDTGFAVAVMTPKQETYALEDYDYWTIINHLGQLHHPNLLKLIGYCSEDFRQISVYEFFTMEGLDKYLSRKTSNFEPLPWKIRMKIALDVAKGLAYLHSDEVNIILGDFEPSKILIDSNHNAKLYNFGMVRSYEDMIDPDMIDMISMQRSRTYTAPECKGRLTKEGDVYSFGVVLLEIMLGKRAYDSTRTPFRKRNLVEWAKPLLLRNHNTSETMDDLIEGQYLLPEAMKVARIVIQCLFFGENRPNMDEVVRSLKQVQDSNDTIVGTVSS